jgi:hypothetical protein
MKRRGDERNIECDTRIRPYLRVALAAANKGVGNKITDEQKYNTLETLIYRFNDTSFQTSKTHKMRCEM